MADNVPDTDNVPDADREPSPDRGPGPLEVMGIFWIALGIIMVIAVYAPETTIGKVTNLGAGLLLLAVGVPAFVNGRRKRLADGEKTD